MRCFTDRECDYLVEDSWENYERLAEVIDQRYAKKRKGKAMVAILLAQFASSPSVFERQLSSLTRVSTTGVHRVNNHA